MNDIDFEWLEEKIFYRDLTVAEKSSLPQLIQTHLFRQGEKVDIETRGSDGCVYIIRSGVVKLIIELDDGTTHLTHLKEGAQIGDLAFIDDSAKVMMEISEDVIAYSIYRASLANFFIYKREVNLKALWPKVRTLPHLRHSHEVSIGSIPSFS
jgi:CRP-like cAMP-binding protein